MAIEGQGSVTLCVGGLKAGDPEAAQRLWQRYFETLVRMAASRLGRGNRLVDQEDVALSAFKSMCSAAAAGRFPKFDDRDDLWRTLVMLTVRKSADHVNRERRQKRGGGKVLDEAALDATNPVGRALDQFACPEPTPEFAVMMAEICRIRLESLPEEMMRQIALLRMEGYTNEEIATRLGCNRRTISRKLELIRLRWEREESS